MLFTGLVDVAIDCLYDRREADFDNAAFGVSYVDEDDILPRFREPFNLPLRIGHTSETVAVAHADLGVAFPELKQAREDGIFCQPRIQFLGRHLEHAGSQLRIKLILYRQLPC